MGRRLPRSANTSPVSCMAHRPSWNIAEESTADQQQTTIPRVVPALTINGLKDPPSNSSTKSSPTSPATTTTAAASVVLMMKEEMKQEIEIVPPPVRSRSPIRDNPIFSRLKQWTDRLNPLSTNSSSSSSSSTADECPSPPPATPASPAKSRKVLSRFFARSRSANNSPLLSRKTTTASLDFQT